MYYSHDDVNPDDVGGSHHRWLPRATRSSAGSSAAAPAARTQPPPAAAETIVSAVAAARAGVSSGRFPPPPSAGADAPAAPADVPGPADSERPTPADAAEPGDDPVDRETAFTRFFEEHHRGLARYAYLLTGDRDLAEDVTAEALTSAWTHWDRVQAADSQIAYVRRTVSNLAAGRARRAIRDRTLVSRLGRQLPAVQAVGEEDIPTVVDVRAALLRLPPRKRECVILRYCLDLSEAETASQLRISIGTVKSQTSKGVAELERLLSSNSGDRQSRRQRSAKPGRNPAGRRGKQDPNHSCAAWLSEA